MTDAQLEAHYSAELEAGPSPDSTGQPAVAHHSTPNGQTVIEIDPNTGVEVNRQPVAQVPAAQPQPQPQPAPQAPTAPEAVPAPTEPTAPAKPEIPEGVELPETLDRRYYTKHLPEETQHAIAILSRNPDLASDLGQVQRLVDIQMGRTPSAGQVTPETAAAQIATQPQAPTPSTPAQPPAPAQPVETEMNALVAERNRLKQEDAYVHEERIAALEDQISAKREDVLIARAEAAAQRRFESLQSQQQDAAQAEAAIAANEAEVAQNFPEFKDPSSEFSRAFASRIAEMQATDNPALNLPNLEQVIAAQIAMEQGLLPVQHRGKVNGQAPVPSTAPAAAAAGQPTRTGVSAVPGSASAVQGPAQVQVAPPNAQTQLAQQATQAAASDDFAALAQAYASSLDSPDGAPPPSVTRTSDDGSSWQMLDPLGTPVPSW